MGVCLSYFSQLCHFLFMFEP